MKKIVVYTILVGILMTLGACGKKRNPTIVFMPDMYYPVAYDPYMEANFGYPHNEEKSDVPLFANHKNMTALQPVSNTVPRTNEVALLPWDLKNTLDDYNQSKTITTSPLNPANYEADIARGKKLYGQTCTACHGAKGDGQGSIVQSKAYSGVPNYADREITVGSVYQVIMYGKNAMGSYAPQLTPVDRWRVAEYVMSLKNANNEQQ